MPKGVGYPKRPQSPARAKPQRRKPNDAAAGARRRSGATTAPGRTTAATKSAGRSVTRGRSATAPRKKMG